MAETKEEKKEEIVYDHGKLKIPTSLIVTIITCIVTALGSCAAAAFQTMKAGQNEGDMKELRQAQIEIVKMQKDIEYIKEKVAKLSGDDLPIRDSR